MGKVEELQAALGSARKKVEREKIRKEVREEEAGKRGGMNDGTVVVGDDLARVQIVKSLKDPVEGYGGESENRLHFIRKCHDFNDAAYLLRVIKGPEMLRRFVARKSWDKVRKAAMDTTDTSNWVPTEMSGTLIDMIRYNLLVGALFEEMNMPTKVYDPPVLAGSATGYLVDESTDDSGTKPTATVLTDGKATLTARKLGARIIMSTELTEDTVIDVLARARSEIARALAEADENAMVNGDTTSPHSGADVDPGETWPSSGGVSDARYAYDGIRKELLANSLTTSLATFSAANLSRMIAECGAYGSMPEDLIWLCNAKGLHKIRTLTEFLTVDKYGAGATIEKGEVGMLFGGKVVVTGKMASNQDTAGVYDTSSPASTKTSIALINRRTWLRGNRRNVTIKSDEDIETDQIKLVATQRTAFRQVYADGQTYGRLGIAVDY